MSDGARGHARRLMAAVLLVPSLLEWTYAVAIGRRLTVQPDLQYVINPGGGASSIANAVVLGVPLAIEF
jgi:carbohydrate-selective porin OprB